MENASEVDLNGEDQDLHQLFAKSGDLELELDPASDENGIDDLDGLGLGSSQQ